jgi:preprotein translocase subunit YajC
LKFKNIIFTLPFFILVGCAQPGGAQGSGSSSILPGIIPFVLIFVLFYFLILRPQQKQSRERDNMIKNLKRGDSVLTNGGIYGKIINVNEDTLTVEIAKGINVRMTRNGIASIAASAEDEKKLREGKSDK